MKIKNIFLLCLLGSAMPVDAAANKVEIKREGGNIVMLPMNDNAIRIQVAGSVGVQPDELIYVNKVENVKYSVCERGGTTTLKVKNMTAVYDAATDAIAFTDAKGKVLLKEISHGRTMRESEVQGEATTAVAQRFSSPADEYLFRYGTVSGWICQCARSFSSAHSGEYPDFHPVRFVEQRLRSAVEQLRSHGVQSRLSV